MHILHNICKWVSEASGGGGGGGGGGERGCGDDILETKQNYFVIRNLAVFRKKYNCYKWTIWTGMSWHIHVSKQYNLIGPYILVMCLTAVAEMQPPLSTLRI